MIVLVSTDTLLPRYHPAKAADGNTAGFCFRLTVYIWIAMRQVCYDGIGR